MKIKTSNNELYDHRKLRKYYQKLWKVEKAWNKAGMVCSNAKYYKQQYHVLKNRPSKYRW